MRVALNIFNIKSSVNYSPLRGANMRQNASFTGILAAPQKEDVQYPAKSAAPPPQNNGHDEFKQSLSGFNYKFNN